MTAWRCWRWAVVLAVGVCAAALQAQERPPAQAFYGDAAIEQVALSPSGRWLAMSVGRQNGRVGLVVFDLQEWKAHSQPALYAAADIDEFHWFGDDRLVYTLEDRQVGSGEQRWWPGLFVVGRDGNDQRQLVKLASPAITRERVIGREPLPENHVLLHVPASGDEVIVGEWQRDNQGEFRGYAAKRLNVVTGQTRNLAQGTPPDVWRWLFDPAGEPRALVTVAQGRGKVLWRGPGDDDWKTLAEYDRFEAPFSPRFVDRNGALFVSARAGRDGTSVLKRFDFTAGRPENEPLVSTPGFDFWGRIVAETAGDRALGVRATTDAEVTVWFDPKLKALQKEADERLPGRINRLMCRRCGADDMVTLVLSYNDREPGVYWLHDAATNRWREVIRKRPGIDARRMGSTDMARVRMRDGLEIPVWVTLPPGQTQEPRPAVVLVHGGPWVRGRHWAWDRDAQFLATRGYVVIEPEFRGSTGYGDKLYRAGWRQWGQAMQDDLVDALGWAVGKGWVDSKRVCIAGASYGGYATLMGLARHGEHFRCGVAWVGVTDPRLMFQWRRDYDVGAEGREYSYPKLIGDPVADKAMLDANTPVLLAERIKAPVMLAYGSNDRRVPLVHGTRMRDALAAAGRPPEWVVYDGEGHGWRKLETRLDFARRLEDFLARHLAP